MPTGIGTAIVGSLVGAGASKLLNKGSQNAADDANRAAADAATTTAQISKDQYKDWQTDFLPLQHDLVADAKKAGSAYEYDRAAELANGDVTQAFGRAKADLSSRLASFGVDPSSGRYASTLGKLGLQEAAASAGAMNKARDAVTDKAWAKKIDVYSAGKGIPAQATAGLSSAANINAGLANTFQNNVSRNAMGIGNLVQKGIQWWQQPSAGLSPVTIGPTNDGTWT